MLCTGSGARSQGQWEEYASPSTAEATQGQNWRVCVRKLMGWQGGGYGEREREEVRSAKLRKKTSHRVGIRMQGKEAF